MMIFVGTKNVTNIHTNRQTHGIGGSHGSKSGSGKITAKFLKLPRVALGGRVGGLGLNIACVDVDVLMCCGKFAIEWRKNILIEQPIDI